MARALPFIVFLIVALSLVGRMHYYIWARLVRDPQLPQVPIVRIVDTEDQIEYPVGTPLYKIDGYLSDIRVSPDGGRDAVWSRDGKELFYRNVLKMLSARVVPGVTFRVEAPRALFEGGFDPGSERGYDVAPDGRFVMIEKEPIDNTTSASIVVVLNWLEELQARAPTK